MANFTISDHHFYHLNIIEYCGRPFTTVPEMNEFMVSAWNSVIQPCDVVYYVGDFAFGDETLRSRILKRLNGREKHLIRGNHDSSRKQCLEHGWTTVQNELRFVTKDGYKILLRHRPIEADLLPPGVEVVIHGHIHNRPTRKAHMNINVSVEVLNYLPVDLDDLVNKHMTMWGYQHPSPVDPA